MPRKTKEQKELENKKITSTKQNKEAKSNSKISANKKNLEPKTKINFKKHSICKINNKKSCKNHQKNYFHIKSSQTKAKKQHHQKGQQPKALKLQ